MTEPVYHVPVLLKETVDGLNIQPGGTYVDVTFGGGGHSREILSRLSGSGHLFSFDQDADAEKNVPKGLENFTFVRSNFRYLTNWMRYYDVEHVDGILADLGVSSHHFDDEERGFSFRFEAPLDMRMDQSAPVTAWTVVNTWPERELVRILRDYGEERYANRIAGNIVRAREKKPVETTLELVDIIKSAMPGAALREKQHPAKRSFQAIRIAVNDELEAEREMLLTAMDRLAPGGRLCVISFHSLEDRIVKTAIREREDGCTCPRDFPVCVCGFVQTMKTVTKPITASEEELNDNPRARSARLRVAERI